jgi:hypothetical protein
MTDFKTTVRFGLCPKMHDVQYCRLFKFIRTCMGSNCKVTSKRCGLNDGVSVGFPAACGFSGPPASQSSLNQMIGGEGEHYPVISPPLPPPTPLQF